MLLLEPETVLASDTALMAEWENLVVRPNFPVQERLALEAGAPGSIDERRQTLSTVLFDPKLEKYRMWYIGAPAFNGTLASGHQVCYAESTDGLRWEKPDLGLVEFNGSMHNNIVAGLPDRMDSASVILDDDGLFKMALFDAGVLTCDEVESAEVRKRLKKDALMPTFTGIAVSPDGVRWRNLGDGSPVIREKCEVGRLMKVGKNYFMNVQMGYPFIPHHRYARCVVTYRSTDLKSWEKLSDYYSIEEDECHVGIAPALKIGETFVGLAGHFYDAPELPEQTFDIDLVYSQDGIHWQRPTPGIPWLRRGEYAAWNGQGLRQCQGAAVCGDEMLVYYFGSMGGNDLSAAHLPGVGRVPRNRFAMATIQVGWDIHRQEPRHGFLRTKKVFSGVQGRLLLNCGNLAEKSFLTVTLTDEAGKALAGFERSLPLRTNGLAVPVAWETKNTLPEACCIRVDFYGTGLAPAMPQLYDIKML